MSYLTKKTHLIKKKTKTKTNNKKTKTTKKNMTIINLIQQTKILILKRKLNKNKLFWSSDTNLMERDAICWSPGGFRGSIRNYQSYQDDIEREREREQKFYFAQLERERKREEFNNRYKISWTKDYKNLNNLLSIKGLDSNKVIDENNIRYLVFSVTSNKYHLSGNKDKQGVNKAPSYAKARERYILFS